MDRRLRRGDRHHVVADPAIPEVSHVLCYKLLNQRQMNHVLAQHGMWTQTQKAAEATFHPIKRWSEWLLCSKYLINTLKQIYFLFIYSLSKVTLQISSKTVPFLSVTLLVYSFLWVGLFIFLGCSSLNTEKKSPW